jgi:hypothetical protein
MGLVLLQLCCSTVAHVITQIDLGSDSGVVGFTENVKSAGPLSSDMAAPALVPGGDVHLKKWCMFPMGPLFGLRCFFSVWK